MAEHDCPPSDGFSNRSVFTLGISRHVDAPTERNGAGVEALGQRRLPGADDAREDEVGGGDDSACVEHPRVVHERAARVEILADEHPI